MGRKREELRGFDDIYDRVPMESVNIGFGNLERTLNDLYDINLDPDYQRDHVWTEEQQRKYVGFILQGGEDRPMIINIGPRGNGVEGSGDDEFTSEMLDGKQRYTALTKWNRGEIRAELWDGTLLHYDNLLDADGHTYLNRSLNTLFLNFGLVRLSRVEALEYYLRLNFGGTVHSSDELRRVRKLLERELGEND